MEDRTRLYREKYQIRNENPCWSAVALVPCDGNAKRRCTDSVKAACANYLPLANDRDTVSHDPRKHRKAVASDRTPKRCAPSNDCEDLG